MGSCIPSSRIIGFIGAVILPSSPRGRFTTANAEAYAVQSWPEDPIGSTTVLFSGVNSNTEIRVYTPDGTELAGVENSGVDPTLSWLVYAPGSPNNNTTIRIINLNYKIKEFPYISIVGDVTIPVQQEPDPWFSNPL